MHFQGCARQMERKSVGNKLSEKLEIPVSTKEEGLGGSGRKKGVHRKAGRAYLTLICFVGSWGWGALRGFVGGVQQL